LKQARAAEKAAREFEDRLERSAKENQHAATQRLLDESSPAAIKVGVYMLHMKGDSYNWSKVRASTDLRAM
jgi:hypothetical protein